MAIQEDRNDRHLATLVACPKEGEHPYTLFLGAGASVTSGIPTASGMIEKWRRQLFEHHQQDRAGKGTTQTYEEWLAADYEPRILPGITREESEYSGLFRHFHPMPSQRQIYLEDVMERARPTWGYLYLGGLIAKGRINRILTTNFDDLTHDALFRYYDIKPVVCPFDSAVTSIRINNSKRPKIIKLHGDYLYDNLRNVRDEVKQLGANMEEKLIEMCKDSGLIVVGYGGNDDSIMEPLSYMLRRPGYLPMGIHWCYMTEPGQAASSYAQGRVADFFRNYPDKVHLYAIRNFDHLMETMFYASCTPDDLPQSLTNPSGRNLALEFKAAIERGGGGYRMSANMERDLAFFLERAQKFDPGPQHFVSNADMQHRVGNRALRVLGDLDAAEQAYQRGYAAIEEYFSRDDGSSTEAGRFELFVAAQKRLSGLHVGLAEVFGRRGEPEWRKYVDATLDDVSRGIELCSTPQGRLLDDSLKRQFPYNGICAYALQAEFGGSLSDEEKHKALGWIDDLKRMDPQGYDVADLEDEYGYRKLQGILVEAAVSSRQGSKV